MSTLRVILDPMVSPVPDGVGRYTEELTRALIATAPRGSSVSGVVAASPEEDYARIAERLPGLDGLFKNALAARELRAAWQHGFTRLPGRGMVHAPSLLAPLFRHDRHLTPGTQTVVTVHDVAAWTHPETMPAREVSWHKAMARRAERYADALVVPTHAVAAELGEILDVIDRVRVIGGGVGDRLRLPDDADARAAELGLPSRFLLAVGAFAPRKGLEPLIRALALDLPADVPLLVTGEPGRGAVDPAAIATEVGLAADRVRLLGALDDADLAVVLDRAAALVVPSLAEGFGLPVIEAFSRGTPVIHSDAPALSEVAAGAGLEVSLADAEGYPQRLADAIRSVLDDPQLAERLSVEGRDRAGAFSWRDSAEKVWQLHADL